MKIIFKYSFVISLLFIVIFTSVLGQDGYDNYVSLTSEFNGHYNSGSSTPDGTIAVSETDLNAVYQYPISNYSVGGANINVTLTYSGQVQFSSFSGYKLNGWVQTSQKKPAWILGVNGFAVDMLKINGLFSNPVHSSSSSDIHQSIYYNSSFLDKYEAQLSEAQKKINFYNKDIVWMADGFDFCTNMKNLGDEVPPHDKIYLLKSDGSLLQLINQEYGKRLGVYGEVTTNSQSYAYVKQGFHDNMFDNTKYYDFALNSTNDENINVDDDYYFQDDRVLYYYPGDGYEYVFQEYTTPYGNDYVDYASTSDMYHYYSGQLPYTLNYGISSSGVGSSINSGRCGSPKIFYLVRINHQNRELIRLTYDWHITNEYDPSYNEGTQEDGGAYLRFSDGAIGRAKLKYFNHHHFEFNPKLSTYSIKAFNTEYIINLHCKKDDIVHVKYKDANDNLKTDNLHGRYDNATVYGLSSGGGWVQHEEMINGQQQPMWHFPTIATGYMTSMIEKNEKNALRMKENDQYNGKYTIRDPGNYFTVLYYPKYIEKKVWNTDYTGVLDSKLTQFSYEFYKTKMNLGTLVNPDPINIPYMYCGKEMDAVLDQAKGDYKISEYERANTHVILENRDIRLKFIGEPMRNIYINYQKYIPDVTYNGFDSPFLSEIDYGIGTLINAHSNEIYWKTCTNPVADYRIFDKYSEIILRSTGYSSPIYMDKVSNTHQILIKDTVNVLSLDNSNSIQIEKGSSGSNVYLCTETLKNYEFFTYYVHLGSNYSHNGTMLRLKHQTVTSAVYDDITKNNKYIKTINSGYEYNHIQKDQTINGVSKWYYDIKNIADTLSIGDESSISYTEYDHYYIPNELYKNTSFYDIFAVRDISKEYICDAKRNRIKSITSYYQSLLPETGAAFNSDLYYLGLSKLSNVEYHENNIFNEQKYRENFLNGKFAFKLPGGLAIPRFASGFMEWDADYIDKSPVDDGDVLLGGEGDDYQYESCFWTQNTWYSQDKTTWIPSYPIMNLAYKEIIRDKDDNFLSGTGSLINSKSTLIFDGKEVLSYSRGKEVELYQYFMKDNDIHALQTDSIVYSFGYQGGGLPFKHRNANGALTVNYYLYNHNNSTSESCVTNPLFSVEDFYNKDISDNDNAPCECSDNQFYTPSGIIASNDNNFYADKLVETRNMTTRNKPVAVRQFVRKYFPYDGEGDGLIDQPDVNPTTMDEVKMNGVNDIKSVLNDDNGHIISQDLSSVFSLDHIYEYNVLGTKTAEIDPNHYLSNIEYDHQNRLLQVNTPYDFVNPENADICGIGSYLNMQSQSATIEVLRTHFYQYTYNAPLWEKHLFLDETYESAIVKDNATMESPSSAQLPKMNLTCYEKTYPCESTSIVDHVEIDPDLGSGTTLSDLELQLRQETGVDVDVCIDELSTDKLSYDVYENELVVEFSLPDVFSGMNSISDLIVAFRNYSITSSDAAFTGIPGTFYLALRLLDKSGNSFVTFPELSPIIIQIDPNNLTYYPESKLTSFTLGQGMLSNDYLDKVMLLLNDQSKRSACLGISIVSTSEEDISLGGFSSDVSVAIEGDFYSDGSTDGYVRKNYTSCDYTLRQEYGYIANDAKGLPERKFLGSNAYITSQNKIDDDLHSFNSNIETRYSLSRSHLMEGYRVHKQELLSPSEYVMHTQYMAPSNTKTPFMTREVTQGFNSGNNIDTKNIFNDDGSIVGTRNSFDSETTNSLEIVTQNDITDIYDFLTSYFLDGTCVDFNSSLIKTTVTNNAGRKTETYTNILGNKIIEIQDAGDNLDNKNKTTLFKYDDLDRVTMILNLCDDNQHDADDQEILYSYDELGRVNAKYQPDLGIESYRYDPVGNLRFAQSQKQYDSSRVSFFQYDDLNRLTISGEVELEKETIEATLKNKISDYAIKDHRLISSGCRMTDALNADALNDCNISKCLTANKTLWYSREDGIDFPIYKEEILEINDMYPLILDNVSKFYDNDEIPSLPLLVHKAPLHDLRYQWGSTSPSNMKHHEIFENIVWFPDLIRTANYYDELPPSLGTIWEEFPDKDDIWNQFAKKSYTWEVKADGTIGRELITKVRNLKGRKAAVAYRESGALPFNYMVFSYDARGRLDAILKYTDNLGFDAVYYYYNSADKVICQITAGPLRHQITWNEYDDYGRLHSVFTTPPIDRGLCKGVNGYDPSHPDFDNLFESGTEDYTDKLKELKQQYSPLDVEYNYYMNGLVESVAYVDSENGNKIVKVSAYDGSKRLKTNVVTSNDNTLYIESINYDENGDNLGFIDNYSVLDAMSDLKNQASYYDYDNLGQLVSSEEEYGSKYVKSSYSRQYAYDYMGNRQADTVEYTANVLFPNFKTKEINNYTKSYNKNSISGANTSSTYGLYNGSGVSTYRYTNSGELQNKMHQVTGHSTIPGQFVANAKLSVYEYDSKGLLHRYAYKDIVQSSFTPIPADCIMDINDDARIEWRYAYNPMGDREQKRVFYTPDGDNNWNFYPWTYNLMGSSGNALAVYHGAQISDSDISYGTVDKPGYSYNLGKVRDQLHVPYKRNLYDSKNNNNIVFMYPAEFNPHPGISYRPVRKNQYDADWAKYIMLTDRWGSTKLVLGRNENEGFSYEPFGKQIPVGDADQRTAYLGKELDTESELGDHGVRKVDYELGRFTTIDPLWEKYYAWSPYQYSMNNPVSFLDENGLFKEVAGGNGDGIGDDLINVDKNRKEVVAGDRVIYDINLITEKGTLIEGSRKIPENKGGRENCVGFAFTETPVYFIHPMYTDEILDGEGYTEIDNKNNVKRDDIVVFTDKENNEVIHVGKVTQVKKDKNGNILSIKYKWRGAHDNVYPTEGYFETTVGQDGYAEYKPTYFTK